MGVNKSKDLAIDGFDVDKITDTTAYSRMLGKRTL